jgi:hypothetical protein
MTVTRFTTAISSVKQNGTRGKLEISLAEHFLSFAIIDGKELDANHFPS